MDEGWREEVCEDMDVDSSEFPAGISLTRSSVPLLMAAYANANLDFANLNDSLLTCAGLNAYCTDSTIIGNSVRVACPWHCGCADPAYGLFQRYAADGCNQLCRENWQDNLMFPANANAACQDVVAGGAAITQYAASWYEVVLARYLALLVPNGNASLALQQTRDSLIAQGCDYVAGLGGPVAEWSVIGAVAEPKTWCRPSTGIPSIATICPLACWCNATSLSAQIGGNKGGGDTRSSDLFLPQDCPGQCTPSPNASNTSAGGGHR